MAKSRKGNGNEKGPVPPGMREVFAARIVLRNGRVLIAAHYGLRAFRFFVPV